MYNPKLARLVVAGELGSRSVSAARYRLSRNEEIHMTTHRNDGLPELPEPMAVETSGDYYTADQMRDYGEACRRASPSVGGVRVPDRERRTDEYEI